MIVADVYEKQNNAKHFKVEVFKGMSLAERGKPVAILKGASSFTTKRGELVRRECHLARRIVDSLDVINELLEMVSDLEKQQRDIEIRYSEYASKNSIASTDFMAENKWMVENKYYFYEDKEARSWDDIEYR